MAGFWMGEGTQERMDLWLTRALVLLSFAAHLTLAQLAGIRRRRDSGMQISLVWVAYHVTEIITPIALGKVFLDTATAVSEHVMFAFWAPFLLLHLGRPDNITSYALENKELSPTQKAALVLEIGGAIYGSYKQRFMRHDRALCAAFFIMLFFGSYKYVERAVALRRASFDNIRRSNKKKFIRRLTFEDQGRKRDNDDALLDAHGLLGVTMAAFADYQVDRRTYVPSYSCWRDVSKVVEMEASLMYDMLYTKSSVIHTLGGYIIRVLSPPATATALYLFHSYDGLAMERADRMVTYTLLIGTLMLDVRWLLRALGSTWTYAFLISKKGGGRAVMQPWYLLRRILISLDPSRLSLRSGPSGHRLLPGSGIGQRNLLHECSTPQVKKKKMIDVKDELSQALCEYLVLNLDRIFESRYTTTVELADYMRDNARSCSFERNLIAFHVATDIFLLCRPTSSGIGSEASAKYERQIRALSDYMMFLLAQRQHMVLPPGDEGGEYKKVRLHLKKIWREIEVWRERRTGDSQTTRETELAYILLEMHEPLYSSSSDIRRYNIPVAFGAYLADRLLDALGPGIYGTDEDSRRLAGFILVFTDEAQTKIKEHRDCGEQSKLLNYLLKLILASWVRLLTFTSDQCSSDSHAKQLSCGGELLTIAWLMKRHTTIVSKRIN
ncbi:hypothetical protein CFC21_090616 [Triticum aestivum]|uniref:DUF4220 domain-containing protein n=2 Tax=Triticum aestivum TaxID=4565 RepID=A0A9R1LEM3_WHEAT|nr:uncharacterized protein LOC123135260 [Triticum aestivum]KAF7087429.1 hypothetical protein CFC21_090616 [Triticum aestivum]